MAIKGDVPVANAQILIHETSRRGLAALYRKAAMPENLFDAIRAAVEAVDETGFDGDPRDLDRFRARVISRVSTVDLIDGSRGRRLSGRQTWRRPVARACVIHSISRHTSQRR